MCEAAGESVGRDAGSESEERRSTESGVSGVLRLTAGSLLSRVGGGGEEGERGGENQPTTSVTGCKRPSPAVQG